MKIYCLIPLLFLSACSTAPKLALRPQSPPPLADDSAVRYPEVVRAYHFGRYTDPNDDLIMHEQHVVYRVEENTRWDLHPAATRNNVFFPAVPVTHDAAFNPAPVNDAVLAEVNSQKAATAQIMRQSQIMSAALAQLQNAVQTAQTNFQETARQRAMLNDLKQRLAVLESVSPQPAASPISATNEPSDLLSP